MPTISSASVRLATTATIARSDTVTVCLHRCAGASPAMGECEYLATPAMIDSSGGGHAVPGCTGTTATKPAIAIRIPPATACSRRGHSPHGVSWGHLHDVIHVRPG